MRSLVQLVRAPAALSVPGDVLAGAAAAGFPLGARTVALPVASVCLYWAGMALNDYADRRVDAVERPERPIPSGRVRPGFALGLATGLTATGLAVAGAVGGRRALRGAVPLAAAVWAYDLLLKRTVVGPVGMAAARALDVLLGAGAGSWRPALPTALVVGAHTFAVTALSRNEVRGGSPEVAGVGLLTTAAVTAAGARATLRADTGRRTPLRRARRLVSAALLAGYAVPVGRAQLAAISRPTPHRIRRAVGAGILGMVPLQAALTAAAGAPRTALALALGFPLARRLTRKVSPT
ncbi:MAG TPA: UbiA family prenyltransferase [Pseudonocardiaceae bacterium]